MLRLVSALVVGVVAVASLTRGASSEGRIDPKSIELGNFSVSLTVKDLAASLAFYEKLGFRRVFGEAAQRFVIVQNGTATIGLFQGMFERNTLTFNPGWDRAMKTLPEFDDVRSLQETLEARGFELTRIAGDSTGGPASFQLVDPDGNPILVDQHVPTPEK